MRTELSRLTVARAGTPHSRRIWKGSTLLNICLVGCGHIAKRHGDLLGSGSIEGASLAGVCDTIREKAQQVAAPYGVPTFADMHEMMRTVKPDAVAILTHSGKHAQHTIELAPYGAHVIVEKPMALTLPDADAMIRACDEAGVKLFVVKQNRFNVPVVKLREALETGRFGKLVLGTVRVRWCRPQSYYDQDPWRGTWALDGGVLTNQASHHIDLLEWMMGDVAKVSAMSATRLVNIEAEDTAVVILTFANGALGIIEATGGARPSDLEGSLSILGEGGSVVIGGFAANRLETWKFVEKLREDDDVVSKYSANPPGVSAYGHKAYYDHVIDVITRGGPQLVDGLRGRRSLELIFAIYESIETGRVVNLRFDPMHAKLGRANG